MAELTTEQKLEIAVKALDSKRGEDIQAIGIGDLTILADYFIIANGGSTVQTKAMAEEVEFKLSQQGIEPHHTEGYGPNNWIVLDYRDIVVHVFNKETRDQYKLERLWTDGKEVDISKFITKES
ncbi:ribosome silencing factor [Ruminococcus albus]|uniref:Ribosomal silencing factor RsfS n=1 Tax=Ruminococcus albus TaxID=1264 RepID=A0A1I1LMD8_RUMAL|nr:ribosome silencing factor [Ruminococcus albus]SFC74199.1 ribosome-associated protein [Ruminococcus albus]